jgi:hypothetical protein
MYDTNKILDPTLDNILLFTTEYDIYLRYIGNKFDIGKIMSSPFREDIHPSFGIFKSIKNGKLMFKDLATGWSGDCIMFVAKLFNITYIQALHKVYEEVISKKQLVSSNKGKLIQTEYENNSKIISIKRRYFSTKDKEYWSKFRINKELLDKYNVFPISHYWINDNIFELNNTKEDLTYAYKVYNKFKIYKPYADKKYKFISNCTSYDLFGMEQLEESGEELVITKSLKDLLVLKLYGIKTIATQGETHIIPDVIISNLKQRFKTIYVLYDNDIPGLEGGKKLADKHDFKHVYIPQYYNVKDIAESIEKHGWAITYIILNSLVNGATFKEICK